MASRRTTVRSKAAQSGMDPAGIRVVAIIGGATKVLRVYRDATGGYSLYNLTAGMVPVTKAEANRYRYVTVRYADAASTNLGYLRYQNMLADSFIPEHQRMTLAEVLGGTRWDNVRDIAAVRASLIAQ